ncbi:Ig-like domain-containing protein [Flavobacterium sp. A45]|uniref:Ig-like domain-containing protein n=1 Tax=Flavobacterium sp. A45 TaxID=1945862 RepID=UPI000985777B|nr:Ig-like domain-containing protein [Flavobacterium sp. A45]OOG78160.1 hypothetical protein B0E44_01430 [Flavobacterium sp. A45]
MKKKLPTQPCHLRIMKKGCLKLFFITALLFLSLSTTFAQSTDKFFGMNYWEYAEYSPGVVTDLFKANINEIGTWNLGVIRIGGNYNNTTKNDPYNDKDWYVTAIQNAKSIGGIPLVQLPIDLTATQVGEWMDYFNVTKNLGIIYWGIGNEPDPSSNFDAWYANTTTADGRTFQQFAAQFKTIATKIKQKDVNSIICGPDFRHWWGTTTTGPFGTWYKDFLYNGANAVCTATYNGDPLVDIFAFHFYGDGGSGNYDEGELSAKYATMMTLINSTNALRPANQPLKVAVGEYQDNYNNTGFRVGQRLAIMSKQSLKNNAVYIAPWSLSEGWSWSMIDKTTGKFYSSAHHYKMLGQNKRDNYMSGQINNNNNYDLVEFGMQDANGYTIMLINENTTTDFSYSVKFSTTTGDYSTKTGTIKFRFNAAENIDFNGTITKASTLLFTFDANGNMLKKMEYKSTDTNGPVTTPYNVPVNPVVAFTNITEGQVFAQGYDLTPNVSATHSSGITGVKLYLDNVMLREETLTPFDWGWSTPADDALATLSAGNHTLKAVATSTDGNTAEKTVNISIQSTNTAPTVSITAPTTGTAVTYGATINITATAADTAPGTVSSVSFYDGTTLLGTDTTSPYSYSWLGATVGSHSITAKATDNNNAVTTSATAVLTVNAVNNAFTSSYFHLIDKFTADYMRPTGGTATAYITQYEETAVPTLSSYQWEIVAAPVTGYYYIVNRYTGKAIQPTGGSTADNTNLSQTTLVASPYNTELQWAIETSDEANYYWIKNRKSGMYIRPAGGANGTGIEIVQNTINTTYSSFKWSLANPAAKTTAKTSNTKAMPSSEEIVIAAKGTSIYPNPASDAITIVTSVEKTATVFINLYNFTGNLILSKEFRDIQGNFEGRVDISNIPSGTYVLKIKKGDTVETQKIIKK